MKNAKKQQHSTSLCLYVVLVAGVLWGSSLFVEEEEDGMIGSCDSPAGSLRARGSAGTSRLRTVGSNSDRTTNGECNTMFI